MERDLQSLLDMLQSAQIVMGYIAKQDDLAVKLTSICNFKILLSIDF